MSHSQNQISISILTFSSKIFDSKKKKEKNLAKTLIFLCRVRTAEPLTQPWVTTTPSNGNVTAATLRPSAAPMCHRGAPSKTLIALIVGLSILLSLSVSVNVTLWRKRRREQRREDRGDSDSTLEMSPLIAEEGAEPRILRRHGLSNPSFVADSAL